MVTETSMHSYTVIRTTVYPDCDKHLMVCSKCGKTKVIRL